MPRLKVATYNIHCGIGRDGRFSERRVRDVLREIDADVFALQEVESRSSGLDMLAWLAKETGFHAVWGTTLMRADGHYGNGLLARFPIANVEQVDLTWERREPRNAIAADLDCGAGERLRFVATHLGLRPAERRYQVRRLLPLFVERPGDRVVLAGDVNEWWLWGRPLKWLQSHFLETPPRRTFPAWMPMLALDRLWAHPGGMLREVRAHRSRTARAASDHLPLVATLEW
jgi:endonuclease/exonuclease/phosphatase family metal-dependent hydrolase